MRRIAAVLKVCERHAMAQLQSLMRHPQGTGYALSGLALALPLSAYAAFNVATKPAEAPAALSAEAPAPANIFAAQTSLPRLAFERTLKVGKGETFAAVMHRSGFSATQISKVMAALSGKVKLDHLKPGTEMDLAYTEGDPYAIADATLTFRAAPGQVTNLKVTGETASAAIENKPLVAATGVAVGHIKDSLYEDATEAGLSPAMVKQFMDIFAWDIDYTRDIHPGDTFKVTYEETRDDRGQRVKTGRILAAAFTVKNETRQAFWFTDGNGRGDYYNEKGETKRKLLLRTPLEVYRISSVFGKRNHPVLGFTRMHKGTDFAAAYGTPVKASGDGVVVFKGVHGGHGNFVEIKHTGTIFETAYAHLSRYANIKVGSRVKQGQVIGYVGSTGLSTGPHLHYEVHKNGIAVNPMSTDLPTGTMMAGKAKARFFAMVDNIKSGWTRAFTQIAQNAAPAKRG